MKYRILLIYLAGFFGILLLSLAATAGFSDLAEIDVTATPLHSLSHTHPRLNYITNAFYLWHIAPFITFFAGLADSFIVPGKTWIFVFELTLFTFGTIILIERHAGNIISSILLGAATSCLIIIQCGFDQIVLGALCLWPLLVFYLTHLITNWDKKTRKNQHINALIFILISCAFILTAEILALPLFALALAAVKCECNTTNLQNKSLHYLFGFVAVAALLPFINAHSPSLPPYPQFSHIVPDDGLPGFSNPLAGSYLSTPIINKEVFNSLFKLPSLFLCAGVFATLMFRKKSFWLALGLCACLCIIADCAINAEISDIGPLAALSRILPGYIFLPLTPLVFSIAVLALAVHSAPNLACRFLALSIMFLLAFLSKMPQQAAANQILISHINKKLAAIGEEHAQKYQQILISPSFNVIRTLGPHVLFGNEKVLSSQTLHLQAQEITGFNSSNGNSRDILAKMFDGRSGSRWASGGGNQNGSEWLQIELGIPRDIIGLVLDTGNFVADFPRGLQIEASSDCSSENSNYTTVFSMQPWEGALEYTSDGYPYFGGQQEVIINFAGVVHAKCLKLKQTGHSKAFDWSIAELKLILPQ